MDRPDEKTADVERRASRRISRHVSVHSNADVNDAANNDAYLAAMGISASSGFRPSDNAASTPAAAHASEYHQPSPNRMSTEKSPETSQGPSTPDSLPTTAEVGSEPSSSSSFTSSATSSSASSPYAPSQTPLQLSSVPVSIPETDDQESSSASAPTPSQPPPPTSQLPASRARPSSIAKPPMDALALGSGSGAAASSSGGGSSSHRATNVRDSTASSVALPPAQEEPYQGPSGPSFPYQMYPQNVRVTQTMNSVPTAADVQPDPTYTGPRGAAFPYAMYQQNTVVGPLPGPSTVPVAGIPVGFPGMADNYQRRIGPDGEEMGDMIGPDGHTEQLPPYTRYPDEAYTRKIAAASEAQQPDPLARPTMAPSSVPVVGMYPSSVPMAVEEVPSAASATQPALASTPSPTQAADPAHTSASEPASASASAPPAAATATATTAAAAVVPVAGAIPGAGGLGLAPRNPEYDGAEDTGSPRSHYSLRSFASEGTGPEINTAARGISEKGKRRPRTFIQRYGGRHVLGIIPYWAICLVVAALLVMGIILGAVIGTFVTRHRRSQSRHGNSGPSATNTVDAVPIATPTNLPDLPIGVFSLPLSIDSSASSCFNDSTQVKAWSCSIPYQYGMSMTISSLAPTPSGPMYNISIDCNASVTVSNSVFLYGEQAPVMPDPLPMQLVNDTNDPSRGPAWFQMIPYNKTVVVNEKLLSAPATTAASSSSGQKRGVAAASWEDFNRRDFNRKDVSTAQAGDKPWVCTWPDTVLEVFIYPDQNTSFYNISQQSTTTASPTTAMPTTSSATSAGGHKTGATATRTSGMSAATGASKTTASSSAAASEDVPLPPPPFPRVIKVEERRMAKTPQATCVQYELTDEGYGLTAKPYVDGNGNTVEIVIAETESGPSLFKQSRRDVYEDEDDGSDDESDNSVFDKRDSQDLSKCGCLWMVT